MNISRNTWIVSGKVMNTKYKKEGVWATIHGDVSVPGVYKSDFSKIDVWINQSVIDSAPKNVNIHKEIKAQGKLIFKNNECWFKVEYLMTN